MQKMIERYSVGLCAGAIVTIGLLWVMQAVISTDKNPLNEDVTYRNLEFVKLLDDVAPVREDLRLEKPPDIEEMPPDLPDPEISLEDGGSIGTPIDVQVDVGPVEADPGGYTSDGDYQPIFVVAPIYPRRALQLELEGWVHVKFDVTETGTVENVVVTDAEPKGVFDSAAKKAAEKFRFKPRVVNEKNIRVTGVPYKITFELDDN
ncbi:MAG: TonB family protein [Gammaproteobacteria bacterium]|nr:TonB family protein [Gammaproteobacteria bacterium]MXX94176.1 TonB family protein [Gammaproteobacteria bacterium]MYF52336.1 TonB family protein [Gammaproteobacteria bacterium]MYK42801.1 TonB family protein [Gammaproteobacteria bacterium]